MGDSERVGVNQEEKTRVAFEKSLTEAGLGKEQIETYTVVSKYCSEVESRTSLNVLKINQKRNNHESQ